MSKLLGKGIAASLAVAALTLAASAGCGSASGSAQPAATQVPLLSPPASPGAGESQPTPKPSLATSRPAGTSAPSWPSPEDCISYNPISLTVNYEAGIYSVSDGSRVVVNAAGGPGEPIGEQALALAQRFRKHCFLGRDNTREDKNSYVFDYWREASGAKPEISGQDENCSDYNRNNLTAEDMGGGYGWRVKDHDHVLHLFDSQSDARGGKLVLSKYNQICTIGYRDDADQNVVSYFR